MPCERPECARDAVSYAALHHDVADACEFYMEVDEIGRASTKQKNPFR